MPNTDYPAGGYAVELLANCGEAACMNTSELKSKPVRRAIRCGAQPACASRCLPSRLELIAGSWLSPPLSSMDAFNGAGDAQTAVVVLSCKLLRRNLVPAGVCDGGIGTVCASRCSS